MYTLKPDPKMRKDKKCFVCKEPLPEIAIKEKDPFCQSTCCMEFHGIKDRQKVD